MYLLAYLASIIDTSGLPQTQANNGTLNTVVSIVFGVAGSIALLMIVIGGLRYILARGDPSAVNRARETIIYSVVGLLITMMAFGITAFVLRRVG